MIRESNEQAFFALVQSGLWEKSIQLSPYGTLDFAEIFRLAEEQSVLGLVTAGLENVTDIKIPQDVVLNFVGSVLQIEQRNLAMNVFLKRIIGKLREKGIECVLIKGQGVAQCYSKPLWRTSGDIDLLLNKENYEKGKSYLSAISETKPEEYSYNKEFITTVAGWCLELHGSLRCGLSTSINRGVDGILSNICDNHQQRYWEMDGVRIPMPDVDNDALLIFTHYIKHFYKGGLGIRQICDWCRLLWTYKNSINICLLEERLRKMGLMSEWRAFASYAVEYLGMPSDGMPLYEEDNKWKSKAERIHKFILKVGNFGHNIDKSYYAKYPFVIRKTISMWYRLTALFRHVRIFPQSSIRYIPYTLYTGMWSAIKGE